MAFSLTSVRNKIPAIFRNLFFLSGSLFLIWMFFLDENNVFSQYRLYKQWKKIEEEKNFYKREMEKAQMQYYAVIDDQHYVENFAREKYFMKKDNEDLYIIVPKK
ncbi:MAG TPA: septum formation initiator family protein [Chitinophagales bacterium]